MLKRTVAAVGLLVALSLISTGLRASHLTEQLQREIDGKRGEEFARVLIVPVSSHNSAAMKTAVTQAYATRAEQHRAAMTELKAVAAGSQTPVMNLLRDSENRGQARKVKSFWIANLIEAELTVAEISRLAADPSIEKIDLYPTILSIPAEQAGAPFADTIGVQPNLMTIKADSAWKAGYDGRGRLICSFDTGVDGLHPALVASYHGNKGFPASQCWFSSVDTSTYPHYFTTTGDKANHGTHTMGILVGHTPGGDTIGVAPGADWISAAAIDVPGASVFEAFQWAADPDGDPNTVTDLPDVINHSWGIAGIGCDSIFWDCIDNVEALGIVNIFAAGNEGSAPASLRSPANRAADSITNFAVGNLNYLNLTISSSSSRGPSNCDGVSIKPNVVAPGNPIRSAIPNRGYAYYGGTSMAAPHVAGAVAILRQKNPNATADQIKAALLSSSRDLGASGPDNTFGWGLIDIMAALRRLDQLTRPSLQIAALPHGEIHPGDTIRLTLTLKNVGSAAHLVMAQFANADPGVTILTDHISFGNIARDSSVMGDATLDVAFDAVLESGQSYGLDIQITAAGGFLKEERLQFFLGSEGRRQYFSHDAGRVKFTISNYGAFGFYGRKSGTGMTGSFIPLGYWGYQFDRDTNDMYEGALLIATGPTRVSDCARNVAIDPDDDFAVCPDAPLTAFAPGPLADQETIGRFDDSNAEHPIGLTITQKTYGWMADPESRLVIMQYIITNTSDVTVNGIRVGLFFDWDIRNAGQNHGGFSQPADLGYLCWIDYNFTDSADFRGVKVLNPEGMVNHHIFTYDEIRDSRFTEALKYAGLSDGCAHATYDGRYDLAHLTATGPFNLTPGKSDTAAFALVGGRSWTEFMEAAVRAEQKYDIMTDTDNSESPTLPTTFSLSQNYPNPFNPGTTISFSLPQSGVVQLEIFDILGRVVRMVHNGYLPAGSHNMSWDGKDNGGRAASGIYFYRLRQGDQTQTRKMILVK